MKRPNATPADTTRRRRAEDLSGYTYRGAHLTASFVGRRIASLGQVAAAIAYTFGWRTQGEGLMLEWRQLEL